MFPNIQEGFAYLYDASPIGNSERLPERQKRLAGLGLGSLIELAPFTINGIDVERDRILLLGEELELQPNFRDKYFFLQLTLLQAFLLAHLEGETGPKKEKVSLEELYIFKTLIESFIHRRRVDFHSRYLPPLDSFNIESINDDLPHLRSLLARLHLLKAPSCYHSEIRSLYLKLLSPTPASRTDILTLKDRLDIRVTLQLVDQIANFIIGQIPKGFNSLIFLPFVTTSIVKYIENKKSDFPSKWAFPQLKISPLYGGLLKSNPHLRRYSLRQDNFDNFKDRLITSVLKDLIQVSKGSSF